MAITYIGSAVAGGTNVSYNIDLTTIGLQEGDLVVVLGSKCSNAAYNISGRTLVVRQVANDNNVISSGLFYKMMGATPDTSVTLEGTGNLNHGASGIAYAFRGVEQSSPFDAWGVSAGFNNGGQPNPPSITPVTDGAVVIACGSWSVGGISTPGFPTGYTNQVSTSSPNVSDDNVTAICMKYWTGGVEDPSTFFGVGGGSGDSSAALTWAIKPAPEPTGNFFPFF